MGKGVYGTDDMSGVSRWAEESQDCQGQMCDVSKGRVRTAGRVSLYAIIFGLNYLCYQQSRSCSYIFRVHAAILYSNQLGRA